ncbi:MAG: universal stress protein [Vulcanimicrobiota bacterium]
MSRRYLVPLDGSELAEHALPWASLLARKFGARIELLRCFEPMATVYMMPEFAATAPVYFDQTAMFDQIDGYLNTVADRLPPDLVEKTRCEGDPGTVILDRAESEGVDAIVLASHGRGGIGRWLLGSVTTKVVRGGRIPVLVISSHTEVTEEPAIQRILVPVDGSSTSEAAIPRAVELARAFDAEILFYRGIAHSPLSDPATDPAVKLETAQATEYLQKLGEDQSGVKFQVKVDVAAPAKGILGHADECDLIVMGSHGRSGVQRWLLGSVAEKVIQSASKPVMIVYDRQK